jgi:hypothetical protein
MKETGVKCLQTEDETAHITLVPLFSSQELLKGSKQMKIIGHKIGTAERLLHNLPAIAVSPVWQYGAQYLQTHCTP